MVVNKLLNSPYYKRLFEHGKASTISLSLDGDTVTMIISQPIPMKFF